MFSEVQVAQVQTSNYNSRRAQGLRRGPAPQPGPAVTRASERMRARSTVPGGRRGWAGLPALAGTVPPCDRSRLLLGQLTSNEEQAGREGRACGGASTARRPGGRERRGHVTPVPASGRPSLQPEPSRARGGSETVTGS